MPDYFSFTQVNMFLRCAMQYQFRYVEGLKVPPSGAMTLGWAVDDGLSENYRQKIVTHEDLVVSDVVGLYEEAFDGRKDETDWRDDDPGVLKDEGVGLVKVYYDEVCPTVQPVEVQETVHVTLDGIEKDFVVIPDIIDDREQIRDIKTSAKSPAKGALDKDMQPTAQALGYRVKNEKPEKNIRFDWAVRTKKPKVVSLETARTEEDIGAFLWRIGQVNAAIEKEQFFPTNPTNWWCSEKWCGYWFQCEGGGKRVERTVFT
jgi:putative RecB family exonuclease